MTTQSAAKGSRHLRQSVAADESLSRPVRFSHSAVNAIGRNTPPHASSVRRDAKVNPSLRALPPLSSPTILSIGFSMIEFSHGYCSSRHLYSSFESRRRTNSNAVVKRIHRRLPNCCTLRLLFFARDE